MAQNYSTFKTYILTSLWRENDTDLSNNLDVLIQAANDELDVMTRSWQRRLKTTQIQPESQDFDLTTNVTDFQAIRSLTNNQTGFYRDSGPRLTQVLPQEIYRLRTLQSTPAFKPYYAIDRDDGTLYLRLVGNFSAGDPGDLQMQYRIGIPNYASADSSWLEDEYLNLYQNCIFKHCAVFLREDERIKLYSDMMVDAFDKAEEDDKHNLQFGGSPGQMRPHHVVP